MLCLSGFELCSRWVPLFIGYNPLLRKIPPTNERFQASEFLGYSLLDIISNRSSLPKELFKNNYKKVQTKLSCAVNKST